MKKTCIINTIEKHAPLELQAQWDFSGIQVDSLADEYSHIAVMLDASYANIERARLLGADFILSHHPLSMEPYFLGSDSNLFRVIRYLMSRDMLLYSAHTSLDAKFGGFSSWLGGALGLMNLRELDEVGHFGAIGELENSISVDELCDRLVLSMPFVSMADFRLIGGVLHEGENILERSVRSVCFCTGSGSGMYTLAKGALADIFITGDVKYHTALDISTDVLGGTTLLLDVGHFSLEEEMMRRFSDCLGSELPIEVSFISSSNPFVTIK